ncbi:MAG: ribonuclease HI [Gemmatimonadetes bacterium]|nr:ribonuclease HI [Gemmatimonadota bacterium]
MPGPLPIAVLHLDESCLGNGQPGDRPGGAGGLVETRTARGVERRDFFLHAPATTNNRMALAGAIAAMQLLGQKGNRLRLVIVSDSEYLVKGIREWAPGWQRRGWTRKGGAIENLPLWQALWQSLPNHEAQFTWVRGHAGHPKNEYANDLAVKAATEQVTSQGIVASEFAPWLAARQARGQFAGYDPDLAFDRLADRLAAGERFALAEVS